MIEPTIGPGCGYKIDRRHQLFTEASLYAALDGTNVFVGKNGKLFYEMPLADMVAGEGLGFLMASSTPTVLFLSVLLRGRLAIANDHRTCGCSRERVSDLVMTRSISY